MITQKIELKAGEAVYFASDFHLGIPNHEKSLERERKIVQWLDTVKSNAAKIYLVGDLFDFWFEYKHVVPKGYIRLLGKIAELVDSGIPVELFTGNHDMWMFDYLKDELGVVIHREPIMLEIDSTQIFLGHGDGLGPGDHGYKFIKKVFRNKICQWLFARLHPNFGIGLANYWSGKSRDVNHFTDREFHGEDKEMLFQFCQSELEKDPKIRYFVFGHRHLPLELKLNDDSKYINLGDWISYFTYGEYSDGKLELKEFN